jgi:molybdenum cofactor cytidylyltransferase
MGTAKAARLDAIVLCAGAGSRFGGGKLLAPWGDGLLLEGALAAAFAAPVQTVSVVWGADGDVPVATEAFAARVGGTDRLRLIHAERHSEGMAASLKAGVASLDLASEGAFLFLGDMPRIPAGVTAILADALAAGARAAAPDFAGRRGHPVLFASALYPALLGLTGDRGAASVLAGLSDGLALVPVADDGVLFDVDRPEDLRGEHNPTDPRRDRG